MQIVCGIGGFGIALWPVIRFVRGSSDLWLAVGIAPSCFASAGALMALGKFLAAFQRDPNLTSSAVRQVKLSGSWFLAAAGLLIVAILTLNSAGTPFRNPAMIAMASLFLAVLGFVFIGFSHVLRRSLQLQDDLEGFV